MPAIVTTNLLASSPATLLPLLQSQQAAILTVSPGLALSRRLRPTYCATKSILLVSLRHQLRHDNEVIEIIPPYVQTHLTGEHQANDPNAASNSLSNEVMEILCSRSHKRSW